MDVSHPDSPNYGKHWSANKVAATFSPTKDTVDAVRGWLHSTGLTPDRLRLTPGNGWIEVNATVNEVERLLEADYHVYYNQATGAEHIGSLPLTSRRTPLV